MREEKGSLTPAQAVSENSFIRAGSDLISASIEPD